MLPKSGKENPDKESVNIRLDDTVTLADCETIAGWEWDDTTHYFWCGTVMEYPPTGGNILHHANTTGGEEGHHAYLIRVDGVLAGFAELNVHGAVGMVERVLIAPPLRGRGVGQLVFVALEREARQLGVDCLRLVVSTVNQQAVGCYAKAGFTVVDTFPAPDKPWTKHVMEKPLPEGDETLPSGCRCSPPNGIL